MNQMSQITVPLENLFAPGDAPEFAPPYGAIACLSHQQGRHAEAEATLRDMFARARKQDIRSEPIFTQARQIYRKVQDSLAEM